MTDYLFGFPVHNENEENSMYSRNRLTNGDAELGSTAGWDTTSVSVVPGGKDPASQWVFKVDKEIGKMSQIVPLGGSQAPDYKIIGKFLPEDVISDVATQVQIYGKFEAQYATGEDDVHYLPVMEPMAYKP